MSEKSISDITVPRPDVAHPREVLSFIDLFESYIVKQVYEQLDGMGVTIPDKLRAAFRHKIDKGYILMTEWLWRVSAEEHQIKLHELEKYEDQYPFDLKGVHVPRYRKALGDCMTFEQVWLEHDKGNRHDPDAIAVRSLAGRIGHVPADETEAVSEIMKGDYRAFIAWIHDFDGYLTVTIRLFYGEGWPDPYVSGETSSNS